MKDMFKAANGPGWCSVEQFLSSIVIRNSTYQVLWQVLTKKLILIKGVEEWEAIFIHHDYQRLHLNWQTKRSLERRRHWEWKMQSAKGNWFGNVSNKSMAEKSDHNAFLWCTMHITIFSCAKRVIRTAVSQLRNEELSLMLFCFNKLFTW